MKENLKYNLTAFLEKDKSKFQISLMLLLFCFILVLIFSYIVSIENITILNAKTICENECSVQFYSSTDHPFEAKYIKIKDEKYNIKTINFEEPILDSTNRSYQMITLYLEKYIGNHNEIVKLEIQKNKEKFAKRIAKIIVGR